MAHDNGTQLGKPLDGFTRKNQNVHRHRHRSVVVTSVIGGGQQFHERREDLLLRNRNARRELDCRAVQRSHQQLAISAGVLLFDVVVVGLVDFLSVEKVRREIYYIHIFGIDLSEIGLWLIKIDFGG